MRLKDIIEKFNITDFDEVRNISDDYVEIVFFNRDKSKWDRVLSDVFGPPIKPAGVKPTRDHLILTRDYYGIWDNQTLYKKDYDDFSIIVILWPWQDTIRTTLKMAILKK